MESGLLKTILPKCVYFTLLFSLLVLVVTGPIKKLSNKETRFLETYVDPSKFPAPTVTLCRSGSRKVRLKMYKHFFVLNENQTFHDIISPFYEFEEYYVAGHLRLTYALQYEKPLWEPKAQDWIMTPGDPILIGNCYQLDLSAKLQQGQEWLLTIVLKERKNGTDDSDTTKAPGEVGYTVVVGHKEDFFLGVTFDQNYQPSHKMLDVGKSYNFMVTPQIIEYMSDCNKDQSLTQCIDGHLDLIVPNCTKEMHLKSKCNQYDEIQRLSLVGHYTTMDYEAILRDTSCQRKCMSRLYHLGKINEMEIRTNIENVEADSTYIFLRYTGPKRIRFLKEVDAYTLTDLQADIGGLSGLLLGLSIYDILIRVKQGVLHLATQTSL